jgi:hypothetical protein
MFLTACGRNKMEKLLEDGWVIDQAYIHEEPVMWDMFHNCLHLKSDKTCYLPVIDYTYMGSAQEKGIWEVLKENGCWHLKISTENDLFNRNFEIRNLRKEQDPTSWGYFMKMSLVSDSLKLDCTKVLYIP